VGCQTGGGEGPVSSLVLVEEAVALRRRLHRRPELSGEEFETSAVIREELLAKGLEELRCPTPTGVVALLETGRPGRRVLLRADIDALPVTEMSGLPFSSECPGKMHGCGHDAHAAILVAVAGRLARSEGLTGSYVFCFQPAEETLSGARAMVEGGLLEATRPDRVIGLHVTSFLPSGTVFVRGGMQHAWAAAFRIVLHGEGGHRAVTGGGITQALAEICLQVPGIAAGLDAESVPAVAGIGAVRTDGAWNTSATEAVLSGTHRAFSREHHTELGNRRASLVEAVAARSGVRFELLLDATAPAVVNDPAAVDELLQTCHELDVPAGRLEHPVVFADDVAELLDRVPGCYFLLGARPPELAEGAPHHSPHFRIDEAVFPAGISVLASLATRLAVRPGLRGTTPTQSGN